jgi:PPOX class probable F420-dependent enzyme
MPESTSTGSAISPDLRSWLLEERRYPVMATIGPDGRPSQSVVWFDLDPERDDTVILNTLEGRLKDRHLRRDPRLSLCFEDGYRYVTLEGRAELDDDRVRALAEIRALAHRYGEGDDSFAPGNRVAIRMRVERVIWHR